MGVFSLTFEKSLTTLLRVSDDIGFRVFRRPNALITGSSPTCEGEVRGERREERREKRRERKEERGERKEERREKRGERREERREK